MNLLTRLAVATSLTLVLAACASTGATGGADNRPAANRILEENSDFEVSYMPGVTIEDREWEVELDYDVNDVAGVYSFYHSSLVDLGFTRTSHEEESDEVEADYQMGDVSVELEVELDDGRTQVDFDLDDLPADPAPESFTLEEFAGIDFPFYDADITEIEWDFEFDHDTSDVEGVFDHYDGLLAANGWSRTSLEEEGDEIEANYSKDGVRLELEVELDDDDDVDVEFELNKARFY